MHDHTKLNCGRENNVQFGFTGYANTIAISCIQKINKKRTTISSNQDGQRSVIICTGTCEGSELKEVICRGSRKYARFTLETSEKGCG